MVADFYETLLQELAKALEIKALVPDENHTCLIHFKNGVDVQIEPYRKGESLLIVSDLGELAPGRYRESVFKEALKANSLPSPRHGIFTYNTQNNHLLLFKLLPLKDLNGERIASYLGPFLEKASKWQESLQRGDIPSVSTYTTSKIQGTGIFGLR